MHQLNAFQVCSKHTGVVHEEVLCWHLSDRLTTFELSKFSMEGYLSKKIHSYK